MSLSQSFAIIILLIWLCLTATSSQDSSHKRFSNNAHPFFASSTTCPISRPLTPRRLDRKVQFDSHQLSAHQSVDLQSEPPRTFDDRNLLLIQPPTTTTRNHRLALLQTHTMPPPRGIGKSLQKSQTYHLHFQDHMCPQIVLPLHVDLFGRMVLAQPERLEHQPRTACLLQLNGML